MTANIDGQHRGRGRRDMQGRRQMHLSAFLMTGPTCHHHGAWRHPEWVRTRGPLSTPRSPQGRPVIMQAGSSDRGRDFGARWGEVIFMLQHRKADMQAFYDDFKGRMAARGRALGKCVVLPSIDVVIGEAEAIARERAGYVNSVEPRGSADLVDTRLGLATMSGQIGSDLARFDPDRPLADIAIEEGSRGSFDVILQGTQAEGLTLEEAARPGVFQQFSRAVVPLLQKRGVFRTEYAGRTLRGNLRA